MPPTFTPYRPGSPRPITPHTKVEEELHDVAGIDYDRVIIKRNPSVPVLYEEALTHEAGTVISSAGALCSYSGKKTGRSPKDKRIVEEETSGSDIWVSFLCIFLDPPLSRETSVSGRVYITIVLHTRTLSIYMGTKSRAKTRIARILTPCRLFIFLHFSKLPVGPRQHQDL